MGASKPNGQVRIPRLKLSKKMTDKMTIILSASFLVLLEIVFFNWVDLKNAKMENKLRQRNNLIHELNRKLNAPINPKVI